MNPQSKDGRLRVHVSIDVQSSTGGTEPRRYQRHWTPLHLDLHVTDFDAVLARCEPRAARSNCSSIDPMTVGKRGFTAAWGAFAASAACRRAN